MSKVKKKKSHPLPGENISNKNSLISILTDPFYAYKSKENQLQFFAYVSVSTKLNHVPQCSATYFFSFKII